VRKLAMVAGLVSLSLAAACSSGSGVKASGTSGSTSSTTGPSSSSNGVASPQVSVASGSASGASSPATATGGTKVAMLLTGAINDDDWNYVGYQALQQVKSQDHAETSYNENVGVADATEKANQFVSDGYKVVIFHGSELLNSAEKLAMADSDVTAIGQDATGALPNQAKNLWIVQLTFYPGEYALGYAAGLLANGGKACFISGLSVPSTISAANAALRGMKAANPSVQVAYTFTGDFDDATKGRQAAASMINDGCTSFVVHLNGAVPGVVQAIKDSGKDIPWLGLYTDKHGMDASHYVGGFEFNFSKAYTSIVSNIENGTRTGSYNLGSDISLTPLYNVTSAQNSAITKVFAAVQSGATKVPNLTSNVQVP